jgi:hypothetical protein
MSAVRLDVLDQDDKSVEYLNIDHHKGLLTLSVKKKHQIKAYGLR